jgi:predicted permease
MLFIGMIIHSTEFGRIKIDREMIVLLVGRFIIAPLTVYILLSGIDIPTLMKKVFIIEAAMPAMTQTAIVAKAYGSDHRFAAVAAAVTTTVGMAFIPIYMVLLSRM